MSTFAVIKEIEGWPDVLRVAAVGSRVTVTPPPEDTDADFICDVMDAAAVVRELQALGFEIEGAFEKDIDSTVVSHYADADFISMRRGELNVILTLYSEFYDDFLKATALCRYLNLQTKAERVALFQCVLYGVVPDDEQKVVAKGPETDDSHAGKEKPCAQEHPAQVQDTPGQELPTTVPSCTYAEFQVDFDNMTDEEVDEEIDRIAYDVEWCEADNEWCEAASAWRAAGRPRSQDKSEDVQ